MILDHALLLLEPASTLRLTITRPALPLFLLCTAALYRHRNPSRRRLAQIAAAGIAITIGTAIAWPPFVGDPDVTVVIVLALVIDNALRPRVGTYALGVGALVQALYVPIGWSAYEPGLVVAWLCLARLAIAHDPTLTDRLGGRLPALLRLLGRYPLAIYAAHIAALAALYQAGVS